ncbi:helix-turn-helix transcriptional regulator [Bacteroides thetaiotaomicron]|uniref:helix-turn-helix transcriptional regulator n=1 Tax=Bacteroides thetaiotaomicron TaxID=818 RepID=UPI00216551DF|nr:WYL domain-containing protein [Bacteroides thetaiotaomicron]MCS2292820.1 WYL domain-containing protein [Bacteroides thetaiotaomicron]
MATNKNARLRYEALDKCFSNFSRKFYIEDLQKACYNYLTEQLSIETTVSKRQVYSDIEEMKTSPNMAAPIEAYQDGQRKYYRYSSPGFSIVDLTDGELIELESTINMLTSFRGMPQFDWMHDIIAKLKKKYKVKGTTKNVISFDSNIDLKGIDHFKELFGYIINEQPIRVTYAPFIKPSFDATIHPYYLKQYNNRWFLLGYNNEYKDISVFALDRIVNLDTVNIPFIEDTIIEDPEDYFYYILGASLPKEATPQKVVLQFSQHRYPYAVAKPIHPTQRTNDADRTITLEIIPNRELEAVILSFGKDIEVIEPQQLRESIASVITESYKKYEVLKNGCKSPL